ncbi:MAG: hypothetical protein PHX03_00800 [Bacilli bacterium]|nr:hypothetical protein [Bacilli bacterium]
MKLTKKINYILFIAVSCLVFYLGLSYIENKEVMKLLITITIIPSMLIPYLLNRVLIYKMTEGTITLYFLFLIASTILGSLFNFYETVPMFDKILHFVTGILLSMLGIIILINFNKYDKTNIKFNIIFLAAITSTVALFWEIFEYISDFIFSRNTQRVLETGINDTMLDMISSLFGFTLVAIIYIMEKKTKTKFIINNFIEEVYLNE